MMALKLKTPNQMSYVTEGEIKSTFSMYLTEVKFFRKTETKGGSKLLEGIIFSIELLLQK